MQNFWNNFICFINSNSALWNFLVTTATIFYVVLTYKLLKETKKARLDSNQPYVIVDFINKGSFVYMTVKNFGNDSAFDIKIDVLPKINTTLSVIPFLAPEKQITQNLLMPFSNETDTNIDIKVNYKNSTSKDISHSYSLQLYTKRGGNWIMQESEISDSIDTLTKTTNTLGANILTLSKSIAAIKK